MKAAPIEEKEAPEATVDREAEAAALQAAIEAESPSPDPGPDPSGSASGTPSGKSASPTPDGSPAGTPTAPGKPTPLYKPKSEQERAPDGWKPFLRGPDDFPHPKSPPHALRPYFEEKELELLRADTESLTKKGKKERKRLQNRRSEIRQAWEDRQKRNASELAAEALRRRHLEQLPAEALERAEALDGTELFQLWNGGLELLSMTTGKDLRVEARIPVGDSVREVASYWTDDEHQAFGPLLLELYAKYPTLAEWARTLGGPELRAAMLLAPAALAKVALVTVLMKGAKAKEVEGERVDPKPEDPAK